MAHDSDLYNRWQAAQDYATRVLIEAVKARARRAEARSRRARSSRRWRVTLADDSAGARLSGAVHHAAERERPRPRDRRATSTRWPSTRRATTCARRSAPCWHDELARRLPQERGEGPLLAGLGAGRPACAAQHGARLPGAAAAGPRTWRASLPTSAEAATPPTRSRALSILSQLRSPERAKALERFYERWKDDHLVIDSWFAYQAVSPLASALATVKKLTRHPLFSIKNPNKVRALIGTFAHGNPVNFNRPDGAGYEFVADRVLELDAFNPQIAARLLSAFRSWKALEPERRRGGQEGTAAGRQEPSRCRTTCSRSCRRCWSRSCRCHSVTNFGRTRAFGSRQEICLYVRLLW